MVTEEYLNKLPKNIDIIIIDAIDSNGDVWNEGNQFYKLVEGTGKNKKWRDSDGYYLKTNKMLIDTMKYLEKEPNVDYIIVSFGNSKTGEFYDENMHTSYFSGRKTTPKRKPVKKQSVRALENSVRKMF